MPESFRSGARRHRIAVIDGPNMTNLGARNKRVYGAINSIDELQTFCRDFGERIGVEIEVFVSNYEGAILEFIHAHAGTVDAFVVNPAGLTEVGIPTKHALSETGRPVVEVHFANVDAPPTAPRGLPVGPWDSVFRPTVTGVVMGLRQYSYAGAILGLAMALDDPTFLGAEIVSGD
ncbi:type II 3-dehydroquinate dehydratase [Pseudonocardia sp. MH-G8]|uniref:type II 3-dehydroquinate dehydratase n=1 Tax=Pseudonocardia sp. MH-G8 TaxID=1854588 RepID=UPI0018E9A39F|nr:type II 3-dehydroquinate dehydratase [Pseudonocardia sp. MH-G8]